MKILWFTWKDRRHPQAGGAETVNEELAKRLVRDGHEVIFIVAGFPGCSSEEMVDGFKVIRLGGRYSVYWKAYRYYVKHLRGWADLVIDEMNTLPFFCKFYVKERTLFFPHQLCREIWFYQMPIPFSVIGYCVEPVYLWLIRKYKTVTVSRSSKEDLIRHGFNPKDIHIISEGIDIHPAEDIQSIEKYTQPTMLSLGAIRSMKRTAQQIKTFEIAKQVIPDLQLKLAGKVSDTYGEKVMCMIKNSPYRDDIAYYGKVSREQKIELMQKSHCIAVTSVKEGWGLIVTEANSQGTPAVGYDVDGLRDSIRNNETGVLSISNTPESLALAVQFLLQDKNKYTTIREAAWRWSQGFSFEKSYREFACIVCEE